MLLRYVDSRSTGFLPYTSLKLVRKSDPQAMPDITETPKEDTFDAISYDS